MTFRKKTLWLSGKQARPLRLVLASLATVLAVILSACSSSANISKATASGPQLYMTPVIREGAQSLQFTNTVATISIDDAALTFAQRNYSIGAQGTVVQVNYSGKLASLARGLEELELTYACTDTNNCDGATYTPDPDNPSGWAVELPDQDGGLLQLAGQPFVPLVPAVTCPSMSSAETFLFVTLPDTLITTGTGAVDWNPTVETAYGSVDISASGSTVTFASIKQNTLSGATPANASSSSVTGACSSTVYGNTVAIPADATVTGKNGVDTYTAQAMVGIGPSGLLVEDNGSASGKHENVLGAGTGAIGLPKPSSAVDTSALVGAQYLGFFYGSGSSNDGTSSDTATSWSSSVASFGFSSLPSTCAAVTPQTSTMLYGGDFTGNNPAASTVQSGGGFGNCDFAIDLGAQDTSTNGLYPAATVYVGSGFATNTTGKSYSFPAVAIAGQLNGKFAIFLIGEDTAGSPNQAWGIYLLQSN
jgi:hypothetical protein